MIYLGDFAADTGQVDFSFNTRTAAGAPVALVGAVGVVVYKDDGTTEIPLQTVCDIAAVATGQYNVTVYVTQPDSPFVAGSDYKVVLSAGTVDGTSVAGTVLAQFSIENRVTLSAAEAAVLTSIGTTSTAVVISPITAGGTVTLIQGDSYDAGDVSWADPGTWPDDLATADTIEFVTEEATFDCSFAADTVSLDALAVADTAALTIYSQHYAVRATWDETPDRVRTLAQGHVRIISAP